MIAETAPALRSEGAARSDWAAAVGTLGVSVALALIAGRNGGYFPTVWGWAALVFAWCGLIAVVVTRDLTVDAYLLACVGALVGLACWTWLSSVWSVSSATSAIEGQRSLVYVAAAVTLVLGVRRLGAAPIAGGILIASTGICAYSLATRLFPQRIGSYDPIATYRLASPVGYWNALGLFAAIAALLALAVVARGRIVVARAGACAALVVLVATLYFTFSRGAWAALAIGLFALILLDTRRLQVLAALLVAAPAALVAVVFASRASALTTQGAALGDAMRQGHRVAVVVLVCTVVAAAVAVVFALVERRYAPPVSLRRTFAALVVVALLAAAGAASAQWGSPWRIAQRGWHGFTSPPPETGSNLNSRLFHLSNNNRIVSWRSALHEWQHAPVLGTGAGTFEDWWLAHRPKAQQIRDAHSLYLETLGELGIVGLLLLVVMIVTPLVAAWRNRREPYVPFAAAAFVAWAVHAGVDWDWEVPAVTLPALACAVVCCSGAGRREWQLGTKARIGIGTVAVAIAVMGLVAGIGNQALASSQNALDSQNYAKAQIEAAKAARWAPWLADPWVIQGDIQALNQSPAAARTDFRKAIAKDPRSYLAWYSLAGVETGAARRAAAARVVALNPLSDEAAEMRKILSRRP